MTTIGKKIGDTGENFAKEFLLKNGFKILEQNHWRKWGEIDIIARKNDMLHFVEVKTSIWQNSSFTPEDRVNVSKRQKFARIIETYLLESNLEEDDFQVDIISVYLNDNTSLNKIEVLEDIDLL